MSLVIERAKRIMALLFTSARVGIGSPIILEAIRVILYSLFLLGMDSIVKYTRCAVQQNRLNNASVQ